MKVDATLAGWEPWPRAEGMRSEERSSPFATALEAQRAALLTSALRLCGDEQEARDLVQDTFERALKKADRYAPGTNLRAWLVRIMSNLFIDRCRKKSRTPAEVPLEDSLREPEIEPPPLWAEISIDRVAQAMDRLGGDARNVVELRDLQGKSYDAIAAELGIPRPTVATRLLRARRKLKQLLLGGGKEEAP